MMMKLALFFLVIFVPAQIVIGDLHGINTLEHQPAKLAAIEGLWDGGGGVPASVIGWADAAQGRNLYEIATPKLGSLYLTPSWGGAGQGRKGFPPDPLPPRPVVYFSFRLLGCLPRVWLA